MKNEETFEIELRVAMTGTTYSVEISPETTVQQLMDAFMDVQYLDPKFGLGWKLMHKGWILADDAIIFELIDKDSPTTFELIAKAQGG
jgi:hypothetical protein